MLKNPINVSGKAGQLCLREYLNNNNFTYKEEKPGQPQIDFIVNPNTKNAIYIDCTNQNVGGSVEEKLPHKVWKYYQKYKYKEVYIVEGRHTVNQSVRQHCKSYSSFKVHFVKFRGMINILEGNKANSTLEKFF
tara:strand:+ start:90 stop:491 length:402 start_codon:yes stop_codon:yes gene_type:complete